MKIFTYGIDENLHKNIRKYFRESEVVDVSEQYQDILALSADIVIISKSYCSQEELDIIQEFEAETKDMDETIYIYLTLEQEMELTKAFGSYFGEDRRIWYLQWILTGL